MAQATLEVRPISADTVAALRRAWLQHGVIFFRAQPLPPAQFLTLPSGSAPSSNTPMQHQTRPEFTCRFRWEVGSIAFWDNRCTQHNPVNDYHGYRRTMHRITLAGETPR